MKHSFSQPVLDDRCNFKKAKNAVPNKILNSIQTNSLIISEKDG